MISTTYAPVSYNGDNTTTVFPFTFAITADTDIVVTEVVIATGAQTVKALGSDYVIVGGASVVALTPPAATVTWVIGRAVPRTQLVDYVTNDSFPANTHEGALDKLTMIGQEIYAKFLRTMRQPDGDTANIAIMPAKVNRASKYAGWDANGDPTPLTAPAGTSAVSSFGASLILAADANAAKTTLAIPGIGGTVNGHALIVDSFGLGGMSFNHRSQPNPIINGNADVWQGGTSFPAAANGSYAADCWKYLDTGLTAVVTLGRSTNVPTVAQAGVLFNYSLEVDVTTIDAAIGAADSYAIQYMMEGYQWAHFAQRTLTLSFWVRDSKTGTHCVALRNSGSDRSYVATYTITSADTWERKTITITAPDGTGTWNYTTGLGLSIAFALAVGSNFQTTAGAWQNGNFLGVAGIVNSLDNTANFFRITGVKLELGSVATPVQAMPFQQQLAFCKRYYRQSFPYGSTPVQNFGVAAGETTFMSTVVGAIAMYHDIRFEIPMRVAPTITYYNPGAANAQARNMTDAADCSSTNTSIATTDNFVITTVGNAGAAAGERIGVNWIADSRL